MYHCINIHVIDLKSEVFLRHQIHCWWTPFWMCVLRHSSPRDLQGLSQDLLHSEINTAKKTLLDTLISCQLYHLFIYNTRACHNYFIVLAKFTLKFSNRTLD